MSPSSTPFECVLDVKASLGEGPVWSAVEQVLYWVDINAPSLNRFDPRTRTNDVMALPESIGCFALRRGGGFVAALRSGVWLLDEHGKPQRKIAAAPYDPATHRFNDGRCDPQGRFWPGSMNEREDGATAGLARLEWNGHLTPVLGDTTISNGFAFSPDGRTMYHADTIPQTVRAYDFDPATGTPSRERVFFQFTAPDDRPDGAAVDREGCYWVALYRAGAVVRISPHGEVLARHALPARCPTMPAFGGPRLRTLYVTSARQKRPADELAQFPLSGGIFAMETDVAGLPEPYYTAS